MQVVYAIGILCICARLSEPWLYIDVITADISSAGPLILQIIQKKISFFSVFNRVQWRIQTAEKVTHIKGRLLYQAMILYKIRPFSKWEFLLKEKICSHRERILSFKSRSLNYMGNHFYNVRLAPLSFTIFVTHVRLLRNWRYANGVYI